MPTPPAPRTRETSALAHVVRATTPHLASPAGHTDRFTGLPAAAGTPRPVPTTLTDPAPAGPAPTGPTRKHLS